MDKNELKPLKPFYVCDVESFKWMHFVVMGLTDGEEFWEFGVSKSDYTPTLRFKLYGVDLHPVLVSALTGQFTPFQASQILRPWRRTLPVYSGKAKHDALDRFIEQLVSDGRDKDVYAHFGGKFDFAFVLNHVFFHTHHKIEGMIPRGSGLLCFDLIVEMGNSGGVSKRKKKKPTFCKITFRDSSAMLPFGLKSITKNFGVESPKMDWDHAWTLPFMTAPMTVYNRMDCLGLHQSICKYQAWPLIKRAGQASTIAGQAMRVLRTKMQVEISSLTPRIDEFVRRAYFGGRVEIFKPLFTGPGLIRCADVNSLYPTVMRNPPRVGDIPQEYPAKFKYFTFEYEPDSLGFYEAEVEVSDSMYVPPLGVVWPIMNSAHPGRAPKSKFVFPTGRFKGYWSTLELEYARSLGVKILKTGQGAIFEGGGNFFKRYVDDLYEIRETTERESVDNVLAKLLLNSCYGRFGLKVAREGLVFDEGQEGVSELESGADDAGFVLREAGIQVRLMREPKMLETFNNVAVSAWVTSASRVFMHRHYRKIERELFYTDTDSLFTTADFEDEKGLGGMKIEYERKGACFLLPKTYITQGSEEDPSYRKITMKGFDKQKTKNFTLDDFMTALEGDLKRLRVFQDPKFATFKTAMGRGKILTMLPKSPREVRSLYDKRVVEKVSGCHGYDTRPHKIRDFGPIVV